MLFQTLLASAKQSIHITSPYFLPDRSVQRELICAVQRGVKVTIITPGDHSDHLMTRRASRRRYGELLKGGAEIYEYQPAMIHAKVLVDRRRLERGGLDEFRQSLVRPERRGQPRRHVPAARSSFERRLPA